MFSVYAETLAACGKDVKVTAGEHQPLDHRRSCADDVFAIVQDHEELFRAEPLEEAIRRRHSWPRSDAERTGEDIGQPFLIAERSELTEPCSVTETGKDLCCYLDGQSGLADTPHTGQRDEARVGEFPHHLGHVALAPHERRRLQRQIRCEVLDRP